MTWQQKVWKYGRIFYRAFSPVLVLLLMPGAFITIVKTVLGTDPDDMNGDFYYAVSLFFFLLFFSKIQKKKGRQISDWIGFRSWGVDGEKIGFYFLRGVALNLMLTAILSLLARFSWMRGYETHTQELTSSTNVLLVFASICVLDPIVEEITLRGAMLRELLTGFSPETSILIVSVVFAIGHGNLIWTLYTFFFGIYLARTVIREDMRLIFPMMLHCGFNLPSLVAFFVNENRYAANLFERNSVLYLLYGIIGVGIYMWSNIVSRKFFAPHSGRHEREESTV